MADMNELVFKKLVITSDLELLLKEKNKKIIVITNKDINSK